MQSVITGLIDKKVVAVLEALYNSGDTFYLRELAKATNLPPSTVLRILKKLEALKLVSYDQVKTLKLYYIAKTAQARDLAPHFKKDIKILDTFIELLTSLPNVEAVYSHGDQSPDRSNLLIIGQNLDPGRIKQMSAQIKDTFNHTVSYLTVTTEQYNQMNQMGMWKGKKKLLWQKNR